MCLIYVTHKNKKRKEEKVMNRLEIAQKIALVATILSVGGWFICYVAGLDFGVYIMLVGVLGGFVSYIFGGLHTALKMAFKIAKFGWYIVPFPIDLFTIVISFFIAIVVLIMVPIVPIRKAYKESVEN